MNIEYGSKIIFKQKNEFYQIDKTVTGLAFGIQNKIGRFCDEIIYQNALIEKCREHGLKADTEVGIKLIYKDFIKTYKIDLLVENGVIFELKTVNLLNKVHSQQLLNYLLLTNLSYGKLLNFRSSSVEYEFVTTTLKEIDRFNYSVDLTEWRELTTYCNKFKSLLCNLLLEWGVYLDYNLFNEASVYFLEKETPINQLVKIYLDGTYIGKQKMQLLDSNTILHFSGISKAVKSYETHIRKLLANTDLNHIQWINFNKNKITLKTIFK